MTRFEKWCISLTLFFLAGPWIGGVIVQAHVRANLLEYMAGNVTTAMTNYQKAWEISEEDHELAMWVLKQRGLLNRIRRVKK